MLINTPICTYNNAPSQNLAGIIRTLKKASSRLRDQLESGGGPAEAEGGQQRAAGEEERDEGKKEGRVGECCSFVEGDGEKKERKKRESFAQTLNKSVTQEGIN